MNPEEIIYSITMLDLLRALERRIGKEEASALSVGDLCLARDEVKAAIDHNLDVREYLDEGLDAWEIARDLDEGV